MTAMGRMERAAGLRPQPIGTQMAATQQQQQQQQQRRRPGQKMAASQEQQQQQRRRKLSGGPGTAAQDDVRRDQGENNQPAERPIATQQPPISAGPQLARRQQASANCSTTSSLSFTVGQRLQQKQKLGGSCVIQSRDRAQSQPRQAHWRAAAATPSRSLAGASLKRPPEATCKSAPQFAPPNKPQVNGTRTPLKPLNEPAARWKSSTSNLQQVANGALLRQLARSQTQLGAALHPSQQIAPAKGQWCCELPHHASVAHSGIARHHHQHHRPQNGVNLSCSSHQVTLKQQQQAQDLATLSAARPEVPRASCLRNKRAASSLSLVNVGTRQAAQSAASRQAFGTTRPTARAVEAAASSGVTNRRLRQGALFARRQLHLLPARTVAAAAVCGQPTSAATTAASSDSGGKLAAGRARQFGQATTAVEARRRATRHVLVVPAPVEISATATAAAAVAASAEANLKAFQLVKAEKKASHLTSSSSSLSLNAFVVKRPRKQPNSSASSSCSSINTSSRRWSTSSADCLSLSQSFTQLGSNAISGTCCPGEGEGEGKLVKRKAANAADGARATAKQIERSSSIDDEQRRRRWRRTRFGAANERKQSDQVGSQEEPKHLRQTKQTNGPIDSQSESDNLLAEETPRPALSTEKCVESIQSIERTNQLIGSQGQPDCDEHVFSAQHDESETIGPPDIQPEPSQEATSSAGGLDDDVDIVAISCSPVGFVVEAPRQPSDKNTSDCNTNEYQLLLNEQSGVRNPDAAADIQVTSDNSSLQAGIGGKGAVDMMISMDKRTYQSEMASAININNGDANHHSQNPIVHLDKEPTLESPLDLTIKPAQQLLSAMSQQQQQQEQQETSPTTPKNQPLGPHQSLNITVPIQDGSSVEAALKPGWPIEPEFKGQNCAIDFTLPSSQSTDSMKSAGTQQHLEGENHASQDEVSENNNNVIVKRKSSIDEVPIRLEPICDYYDLETRPFARGKFAQVKRCTRKNSIPSMTTGECYAAKCIKKRRRLVDIKHEILLEIEALKLSYETKHIVRLYEVYETPNEMILVLEMAQGGELQRVLDDEEQIEEPLVRKMIDQILEGLIRLHDNEIAHLDIKPQNLLLSRPFPDGDIKLCDFGISRRITKDCEIREICGTPDYVAPEILRYDPISLATDMWSLGVLTYVLLSGYSPFGSENKQQTFCNITQATLDFPQEIFDKVSDEAVDFIRKLIVREPNGRLTSRQAKNHHWIRNHQNKT